MSKTARKLIQYKKIKNKPKSQIKIENFEEPARNFGAQNQE